MNSGLAPAGSNAFSAAVDWVGGLLLGPLASTIAVITVGSIGLLLLSGRVDVRRATQVITGCFVIFGASTIAAGIVGAVGGTGNSFEVQGEAAPVYASVSAHPVSSAPYDPYAGAALPPRR